MKTQKLRLSQLKVKSFTTTLEAASLKTIAGGKETTPDNTPIGSKPIKDKPIDLPATGVFCPTQGINWCPL